MANNKSHQVTLRSRVKLTGFVAGEEEVFRIVPDDEVDYGENKIPPSSPLARALAGARVGDRVPFHPPGGEVELTILEIGDA
jgi:transcription elongation factor GreA